MPTSAAAKSQSLDRIYEELEPLLGFYAPPLKAATGTVKNKRDYHLITTRAVTIQGRDYPHLCFASLIQQKGYVGFYFMPIYVAPALKKSLAPELLKLLKGKTCFYVKSLSPDLKEHIKAALKVGLAAYKKSGWV